MSTKIYVAYKVPLIGVADFTQAFRKIAFTAAVKTVYALPPIQAMMRPLRLGKPKGGVADTALITAVKLALTGCVEASKKAERDPFTCIDCSFNVWHRGRYALIIPYGEPDLFKNLRIGPGTGIVDYCYWNNTDPPDGMRGSEWRERGKTWDKVCDDWDAGRFFHRVIAARWGTGLREVAARIVGNESSWAALPRYECDLS